MTQINMSARVSIQTGLRRRKKKRLFLILGGLVVLGVAAGLVLYAMRGTASFFRMPSEITTEDIQTQRPLRLGGIVQKGSVQKGNGTVIRFSVTDKTKQEVISFDGILPDLFREGQGIIAEGHFNKEGLFIADRVLAKHDETYVPKDIADRLKAQGLWEANKQGVR